MESSTQTLHRLLYERGVEYQYYEQNSWVKNTAWDMDVSDPLREVCAGFDEFEDGATLLRFWNATPEQAVAATLGRGTCKPTTYDNYLTTRLKPGEYYEFWEPACACSECGELIPMRKFCPNCGAKMVS